MWQQPQLCLVSITCFSSLGTHLWYNGWNNLWAKVTVYCMSQHSTVYYYFYILRLLLPWHHDGRGSSEFLSYSTFFFIRTTTSWILYIFPHTPYAHVVSRSNWQRYKAMYVSPSLPYHIKHARHYAIDYFVQLLTQANNNIRLKHWDGANPSSPKCWTRIVLHPDAWLNINLDFSLQSNKIICPFSPYNYAVK